MKILKKRRRRKAAKKNPKRRRRARRNPILKAVNPVKRRRRKHVKRHSKRRRFASVRRNPSVAGIANTVTGVLAAGAGGVAVVKIANMVGTLTGFNSPGKLNIIKLGLTIAASAFLPKVIRHPLLKSFVDGMGAVTAISFVQTATGVNLLSGASDDIQNIVDQIDGYSLKQGQMLGYTLPNNMSGYSDETPDFLGAGTGLDTYNM